MRKPPEAPPLVQLRPDPGTIVQTRQYRLITPLFGGGVEPGTPDEEQPISGKAIRGHLRFWWRATRGGLYHTVTDLKAAEDERWGATDRPSPLGVVVEVSRPGSAIPAFQGRGQRDRPEMAIPAYAAFPLRESGQGRLLHGVQFVLKLRYPQEFQKDIEAALWAWETFGGIGARTRRGFGALKLDEVDGMRQTIPDAQAHLMAGLQHHVVEGAWPSGVPHLSRNLQFKITSLPWQSLIQRLQDFRQDRPRTTPPGRSRWPEPDAIRRITGKWNHRRGHSPAHPVVGKFPRAVFGLPIVFHFKDGLNDENDQRDLDPYTTTLQGAQHDRLASPLILRPLECASATVGLAAILEGPRTPPGGLILRDAPGNPGVDSSLTQRDASAIPRLDGHTDVLEAFLKSLP